MRLQAVRHNLATKQPQHVIINLRGFDHLRFQKQWQPVLGDILVCHPGLLLFYTYPETSLGLLFSVCLLHWKANFSQQRIVINSARSGTAPAQCERHYVHKLHDSGWILEGSSLIQKQDDDAHNWCNSSRPYVPYFQTTLLGKFWLIPGTEINLTTTTTTTS